MTARLERMSKTKQALYGLVAVWLLGIIFFVVIYGLKPHKAPSIASGVYSPTDEFRLDTWFKLGPVAFNKGVLYLLLTVGITLAIMFYVANHLKQRPGRLQAAVEWFYNLTTGMTRDNMSEKLRKRWFPVIFTLFIFILVSNLIGYIPLPVDSQNTFKLFGAHITSFQIYAAVTNVAVPLVLALGVFIAYNVEGVRTHGPVGYIKSLIPKGVGGPMLILIFPLEMISNFVLRPLSLTIRLWANLLAGHLLIDFMAGSLAVLLGLQLLGWLTLPLGVILYLFEAVLIAGLQAFIFAILTAIYLGGATSASH